MEVLARVSPIVECVFGERLNRFVGTAYIDGRIQRVHITNTGRLEEFLVGGKKCLAIPIRGRKLRYRIVAVEDKGGYAIIDTRTQALAFEKAVEQDMLCFARKCRIAAREPRVKVGRFDYVLDCPHGDVLVELKSAVLRGPGDEALYPDCPTARGVRHVKELARLHGEGQRVAIVFTAAMPRARCFMPYREGDPELYEALTSAVRAGVPVHAYSIYMDGEGRILLENPCLPLCPEWLEAISPARH